MSKIIGVTVGTPIGVDKLKEKIKPVTSVDGVKADENGDVKVQRTHWKEVEPMVSLFNRSDVGATYVQADRIGLEVGESYEVYCDGNFHDAVGTAYAADGETGVTLKTAEGRDPGCSIIDFSPETAAKNGYGLRITTSGSQYSTITITGPRVTWHKMERGYLPDELGNVKTVNDQLPDQYGNVQVNVGVKTVNGQAPDENGNVQVETGGGVGTVQADLAENDPAASGYVKNRTHWKEFVGFAGEVIPNKTLLFLGTSTTMATGFNHIIAAGEKYLVTWNGTVYECVGKEHNGIVYLGNLSFKESGEEASDYPFCIYYSDKKYVFLDGQTSGTRAVVVKVEGDPDVIWHKLDKAYLPDDIGGGVNDYNDLKNKPCGAEMAALLPETTVVLDPDNDYMGMLPNVVDVQVGQPYTVRWNGTDYICTAQEINSNGVQARALGDLSVVTGGESTGEPFLAFFIDATLAAMLGAGVQINALDGSTSATMSITGEVVEKLDIKFLLDGYPYKSTEIVEILPETTLDNASNGRFIEDVVAVKVGSDYTVKWNGVEYICTAQPYFEEGAVPGVMLGDRTGSKPFVCLFYSDLVAEELGIGTIIHPLDGSDTVTFSITGPGEVTHPIALEYLEPFEAVKGRQYEEVFPEETVSLGLDSSMNYSTKREEKLPLVKGNTYVVAYDGVEYKCECKVFYSLEYPIYYLGNINLVMNQNDTGEPFWIGSGGNTEESTAIAVPKPSDGSLPDSVTHTFRIYAPEIKAGARLKPECLPKEAVAVPVTNADNGKFLRVVNGSWAAVALTDVSEVGV